MRKILVDHARERGALKRGAAGQQVTLGISDLVVAPKGIDVMMLDASLERLTKLDPRRGQVVELRVFGGLTAEEVAKAMQTSENTVLRDWNFSLAWLRRDMKTNSAGPADAPRPL
jgi:RNA polymerase sigma factor (TIGR02999 family)